MSGPVEIFNIATSGFFVLYAFFQGYCLAAGRHAAPGIALISEVLDSKRSLPKPFFIVFGLALLLIYIESLHHSRAVLPALGVVLASVILISLVQSMLSVRDAVRKRATYRGRSPQDIRMQIDPNIPTRWVTIGSNVLAVQTNRIFGRTRFGLHSIGMAIGLLCIFGFIELITECTFTHRHKHIQTPLWMLFGAVFGALVGGIAKTGYLRCLLDVQGTRVSVNETYFGDLDTVKVVVLEHPAGYQVRLELPGGAYPRYTIVRTARTVEQAEEIELIIRDLLENQKMSPAWPPAPEGIRHAKIQSKLS